MIELSLILPLFKAAKPEKIISSLVESYVNVLDLVIWLQNAGWLLFVLDLNVNHLWSLFIDILNVVYLNLYLSQGAHLRRWNLLPLLINLTYHLLFIQRKYSAHSMRLHFFRLIFKLISSIIFNKFFVWFYII